ncbi:hypothetical protein ACH5RR_017793 [Cinchona calisaya]|uniref:Uncharacterized protein n=1 Tax=Cinchona calisaya TaxID=153742 RepID=A0ABD2ZJK9_9GENT
MYVSFCLRLTIIELGNYPFEEELFWNLIAKETFQQCCPLFQYLKDLMIRNFQFCKLEIQLLKIIVDNAPSLRFVILITNRIPEQTPQEQRLLEWIMRQKCSFEVCVKTVEMELLKEDRAKLAKSGKDGNKCAVLEDVQEDNVRGVVTLDVGGCTFQGRQEVNKDEIAKLAKSRKDENKCDVFKDVQEHDMSGVMPANAGDSTCQGSKESQ